MSEVETVALWIGLVGGVVSIVLALVAMAFTFAVDRRSTTVNEQVIKSLQKIESTVEGVAGDTRDLIKVAFDRMLPSSSIGSTVPEDAESVDSDESVRAIAAGVAAELRAELVDTQGDKADAEAISRLNDAVERMERTMRAQLRASPVESRSTASSSRIERLLRTVASLSPDARELARQLSNAGKHLTREQYQTLRLGPLSKPLLELRKAAVVAPLQGFSPSGEEIPVYFFAPGVYERIGPVLSLQDPGPKSTIDRVIATLAAVGYPPNWSTEGETEEPPD